MEYYIIRTGSAMGPEGTGGMQTWLVCEGCGAIVANRQTHDDFHTRVDTLVLRNMADRDNADHG